MEGDARWLCCISLLLFLFALHIPHSCASQYSYDLVLGVGNFSSPSGVNVDPNSDALFVVDTNNNRVLRFNNRSALTNTSTPDFVFGVNAFAPTSSSLQQPIAAWVDAAGRLWVADKGYNRVLGFQANTTQDPPTSFVQLGQNSSTSSQVNQGSAPSANTLNLPKGLTVDSSGLYLWVSDSGNNRYPSLPPFRAYAHSFPSKRVLRYLLPPNEDPAADFLLGQSFYNETSPPGTTQSSTSAPTAILCTPVGLFLADTGSNRVVLALPPIFGLIEKMLLPYQPEYFLYYSYSGDLRTL